jgi:hypothetical protein
MTESRQPINTHDQLVATGGGVAITRAYSPGRDHRVCGWSVYRVDARGRRLVTDKSASWYDYGSKVFFCFGRPRMEALAEAKEWVRATYGEAGPWKRNVWGDYVTVRVAKLAPLAPREKKTRPA